MPVGASSNPLCFLPTLSPFVPYLNPPLPFLLSHIIQLGGLGERWEILKWVQAKPGRQKVFGA